MTKDAARAADLARAKRIERAFEWPMLIAALLVIPVILIEESSLGGAWDTLAAALNWLIWLAFATEFAVMLFVWPDRMTWLRKHPLEAAIVFLTPPFLPAGLSALRLFRLLRLLRVAVLAREVRRVFSPDGIRLAAVLAGVAVLCGGAIFADVEDGYSLGDGFWWAITTMATVGYGDLSPETLTGRLVGVGLMFIGIGFFALVTGAIAQRFLAEEVHELEAAEQEILSAEHTLRDEVLAEIRELSHRLQRLERAVEKL